MPLIARFCLDKRGATSIEYAMIATLISIIAVASMRAIGTSLTGYFSNVSNNLS
jgi:pilus assembly protein Flp/PilA